MTASYPAGIAQRDRFVLDRRGPRPDHDPLRHQGWIIDEEPDATGQLARVATIFLTGRECPWRCVMCDLWRHTIPGDTPPGALAAQVRQALLEMRSAPGGVPAHVKLYNAGSFFDPRAVPESDCEDLADALSGISRVIVESHPSLVGPRVDRWQRALRTTALEVAMGLETAHPDALARLHKRMTVDDFTRAAAALAERGIRLRVFLLVHPPFIPTAEQDAWLERSVDVAFACGASAVSLIPTRTGNGALEALAGEGLFAEPRLAHLERACILALTRARGYVFADAWDLDRFSDCEACAQARRARLVQMNHSQQLAPPVACGDCGGSAH